MFIRWNDPAVRLTGRWTRLIEESNDPRVYVQPPVNHTTTTAPGSYFELAFKGESALLKFELGYLESGATGYYGSMTEPYIIMMQVKETKKEKDLDVATKVSVELQRTAKDLRSRDRIVKKSEKSSLYEAMDISAIWLERALAGK